MSNEILMPQKFSNEAVWTLHSVKFETFDCKKLEDFFIKLFKFQIWWSKKILITTSLRDFPSNFWYIVKYKTLTARNLKDFLSNFLNFFTNEIWKVWQGISEVCCDQRSWDTCHTPHLTGRCPWKPFILPAYEENTRYCSFGSFLLMFLRIVFLKFSHVSDDGSEIDARYDVHPSFVIVIWFKS